MRFVLLSDTHGLHEHVKIPNGDVLIHCGDYTNSGMKEELDNFFEYLLKNCDGNFLHIIMIVGKLQWNVD